MATTNYPVVQETPNYRSAAAYAVLIAVALVVLMAVAIASSWSIATSVDSVVPQSYIINTDTSDVPQGFAFSPVAAVDVGEQAAAGSTRLQRGHLE